MPSSTSASSIDLQKPWMKMKWSFSTNLHHQGRNMNSRWLMKKLNNSAVSMRQSLPSPILSMKLRLLQSRDQRRPSLRQRGTNLHS